MPEKKEEPRVIEITARTRSIFGTSKAGLFDSLKKAAAGGENKSNQGDRDGRIEHPLDHQQITAFKNANPHHSTCIETKKESTVGLGFKKDSTEKTLSEFCTISIQDVLNDAIEDYWQVGNGYIEVVRESPSQDAPITGLHHLPAKDTYIVIENQGAHIHYEVQTADSLNRVFAAYGDLEELLKRQSTDDEAVGAVVDDQTVSEVIHLRRPSSQDRWYGFPDWLAAVASVELVQAMYQMNFDFFYNRGVAEFLLFITGGRVNNTDWESLNKSLKSTIGPGNQHKSIALNITEQNIQVQLETLGLNAQKDGVFAELNDGLALAIVSAHRVPPLLAGIQIPGKLGATNELPNALQAFQILAIGPAQKNITSILDKTLGDDTLNGDLGLSRGDFEFNTILEEIDLGTMDTVARMREPVGTGNRDPREGLRD